MSVIPRVSVPSVVTSLRFLFHFVSPRLLCSVFTLLHRRVHCHYLHLLPVPLLSPVYAVCVFPRSFVVLPSVSTMLCVSLLLSLLFSSGTSLAPEELWLLFLVTSQLNHFKVGFCCASLHSGVLPATRLALTVSLLGCFCTQLEVVVCLGRLFMCCHNYLDNFGQITCFYHDNSFLHTLFLCPCDQLQALAKRETGRKVEIIRLVQ